MNAIDTSAVAWAERRAKFAALVRVKSLDARPVTELRAHLIVDSRLEMAVESMPEKVYNN